MSVTDDESATHHDFYTFDVLFGSVRVYFEDSPALFRVEHWESGPSGPTNFKHGGVYGSVLALMCGLIALELEPLNADTFNDLSEIAADYERRVGR